MTTSRKITKEERVAIVKDCLENGLSYGDTAKKHNVSYQQVYTWVKKYSELGEDGLDDRRGKRKAEQEPRSELEEMKIKMAKLEQELYRTKVERDLLKKVEELERRDAYRKWGSLTSTKQSDTVARNMMILSSCAVRSYTYPGLLTTNGLSVIPANGSMKTRESQKRSKRSTARIRQRDTAGSGMIWKNTTILKSMTNGSCGSAA